MNNLHGHSTEHSSTGSSQVNKMDDLHLSVAREFTETPGPRSPDEGKFSGKEFLDKLLLVKFDDAVERKVKLHINLDGTAGYATSFLEAAFGGLARLHPPKLVLKTIEFTSDDEPYLIDEIRQYIKEARE